MQTPRNNLQEMLKRRKGNVVTPPALGITSNSKSKFKPALSVSAGTSSSGLNLPSFSTPGFGKSRPSTKPNSNVQTLKSSCVSNRREIVDISSESSTSSPTNSIKRTSSDPSLEIGPTPASKRVKSSFVISEKENISASWTRHDVSVTAPVQQTTKKKPWRSLEIDSEPNPRKLLDRNFSHFKPPTATPELTIETLENLDPGRLLEKSLSDLHRYQSRNRDIQDFIANLAFECLRNKTEELDMDLVETLRNIICSRNSSIERAIQLKEKGMETDFPPVGVSEPGFQPAEPWQRNSSQSHSAWTSNAPRSISEGPSFSGPSTSPTRSRFELAGDTIEMDDDDDQLAAPPSDDMWAQLEDVPMELEHRSLGIVGKKSQSEVNSPSRSVNEEILNVLRGVFLMQSFRYNQREAIVAALSGQDVFVLMPTGGGKSLCYQLPAVCTFGTTQGLTLVVSPLISLMKDQVKALQEKKVDVLLWNAETSYVQARDRLQATVKPRLVYVTPEKLKESGQAQGIMEQLYNQQALARFVIDEAHCISTWGQDFREAYQDLSSLRQRFPRVPIMALTATATKNTIADIRTQLGLKPDCAFFKQSFNRPNLRYLIVEKTRKFLEQITEFINANHADKSGVIYCLSRKDCENIAGQLVDKGFKAHYYHAGMPTEDKDKTLNDWQKGRLNIIVATIAFGMGIDKPDVRFVLHHCMPKSLDGYYQETGRAGRDGKPADCVLYFAFGDYCRILNMIKKPGVNGIAPSPEAVERQAGTARTVISYCNNVTECRRVQVLAHFDEHFDRKDCGLGFPTSKCDNCASTSPVSVEDVTTEANCALDLVESLSEKAARLTLGMCRDVLRGANNVAARKHNQEPQYGIAKHLSSELVDQVLQTLMVMNVLKVEAIENSTGFNTDYIFVGPKATGFRNKKKEVKIGWRQKPGASKKPRAKKKAKETQQDTPEFDPIESFQEDHLYDMQDAQPSSSGVAPQASNSGQSRVRDDQMIGRSITTVGSPVTEVNDSASILYGAMWKLRSEIMEEANLTSEDEIFDDATLQFLSATCPLDYNSFINGLALVAADRLSQQDANEYANNQYKKYGSRFLSLCLEKKSTSRPQNSETLRSLYTYQTTVSASVIGSATSRKFKASR